MAPQSCVSHDEVSPSDMVHYIGVLMDTFGQTLGDGGPGECSLQGCPHAPSLHWYWYLLTPDTCATLIDALVIIHVDYVHYPPCRTSPLPPSKAPCAELLP